MKSEESDKRRKEDLLKGKENRKFMVRSDSLYRPRVEMKLTPSLLAIPYLPYLPYYYCIGLTSLTELILASETQKSDGTHRTFGLLLDRKSSVVKYHVPLY